MIFSFRCTFLKLIAKDPEDSQCQLGDFFHSIAGWKLSQRFQERKDIKISTSYMVKYIYIYIFFFFWLTLFVDRSFFWCTILLSVLSLDFMVPRCSLLVGEFDVGCIDPCKSLRVKLAASIGTGFAAINSG